MSTFTEKHYDGFGINVVRVERPGKEPEFRISVMGLVREPPHPQMGVRWGGNPEGGREVTLDANALARFRDTIAAALEGK